MKVFLTGATGYIGSAVAEQLKAAGHQVIGLARSDVAAKRLSTAGVDVHHGDLADHASLQAAARRADAVIHAGFAEGVDYGTAIELDRRAVDALLDALADSGKPFIYTSGIWLYGDTGSTQVDEMTTPTPADWGAWRWQIEQVVLAAATRGVRTVTLRPAIVYGRGGSVVLQLLIAAAQQMGAAGYVGTGDNISPFTYIDDLADAYVRALEHAPAGAILNVVGPSVTMRQLAAAVAIASGLAGQTMSITLEQARQNIPPFADALAANFNVSGTKTAALLGWHHTGPSVLDDLAPGSYRQTDSDGR